MNKYLIIILIGIIGFWFIGSETYGAININATSSAQCSDCDEVVSFNHTVNTSDNTILIVGINVAGRTVSGVTNNGTPMTLIRNDNSSDNVFHSYLYYIKNPPIGTNTVSTTFGALGGYTAMGSILLTGVDQDTPLGAKNGGKGTLTPALANVTTTIDNSWVVDIVGTDNNRIWTPTSTLPTMNIAWQDGATPALEGTAMSTRLVSSASAVTQWWTVNGGAVYWVLTATEIIPAGETPPASNPIPTSTAQFISGKVEYYNGKILFQ